MLLLSDLVSDILRDLAEGRRHEERLLDLNRVVALYREIPSATLGHTTSWSFFEWVSTLLAEINQITPIRIGRLYSSRIGHLMLNLYNYISLNRSSKEITIFILDRSVANLAFLDLVQMEHPRLIFLGPQHAPVFDALVQGKLIDPLLIGWKEDLHPDDFSTLGGQRPLFSPLLIDNAVQSNFSQLGLTTESTFVCFHNRDDAFLEKVGGDGNFHGHRNFSFSDYESAIATLARSGVTPVRIGSVVSEGFSMIPDLVDATGPLSEEQSLIWLAAHAELWVTGNSGVLHARTIFKKPILMVNAFPFSFEILSSLPPSSVVLLRPIFNLDTGKELSPFELFQYCSSYTIHNKHDVLVDHGLKMLNNSQAEISDAIEFSLGDEVVRSGFSCASGLTKLSARDLFLVSNKLFAIVECLKLTILVRGLVEPRDTNSSLLVARFV